MLAAAADLIRFDAVSSLALGGVEPGLEILQSHRKVETNATLKELIDRALQKK